MVYFIGSLFGLRKLSLKNGCISGKFKNPLLEKQKSFGPLLSIVKILDSTAAEHKPLKQEVMDLEPDRFYTSPFHCPGVYNQAK